MQTPEFMTTTKGTKLPLLNLKGKAYLQVMHRLVWFREDKPDWSITTKIIERSAEFVIFQAIISKENLAYAVAHKREDAKHFPDFMEKAETGAIGRALAMCGYGTQFAPELDEEDRLVDSPAPARTNSASQGASQVSGTRRPIGPPPQGARQVTPPSPAPETPGANTRTARGGIGQNAPKTASPSRPQGSFADFPNGPAK